MDKTISKGAKEPIETVATAHSSSSGFKMNETEKLDKSNISEPSSKQIEEFKEFILLIKKQPDVRVLKTDFAQETLRVIAKFCDVDEIKKLLEEDEVLCNKMVKYMTRAVIALIDPIKKKLQGGANPDLYNNDEVRDQISAAFGALTNFFGVNSQKMSEIGTYVELLRFLYPFWFHRIYDPFESLPYGVLVNLTRRPSVCSHYTKSGFLKIEDLVERSVEFPPASPQLPGIMEVIQNLSQVQEARVKFFDTTNSILEKVVLRLKPAYCSRVRIAVAGTLKNLAFEDEFHDLIVDENEDVLAYALRPIVGKGQYDEEELNGIPPLLYADLLENEEMTRDPVVVVRSQIIDFLYRLCSRREIREALRKQNVYCLLREYHKWEQNENLLDSLESVVNILVQTEDEIGMENLAS